MAKRASAGNRTAKSATAKSATGAKRKAQSARAAADAKAATGKVKPWNAAEIAEAFRRWHAADPEPKGELEYVNVFTLLVAVVLSAQATDAGVNKATRPLFAHVDTPAKMVAFGEERLRAAIKTIGLFRTKAKNVIALAQRLI
ncbi:MAG: endonuclease III, partial [Rhizobiales bacterium]|nr:endonuclease III [Hyphomicrobiales bacterium]